ncbi:MAG: hypothetical protein IJW14_03840 [Oscillospiraceae bacterium]|nr:hypothetical protein [Oscillospiraceae bacterium]
MDANQLLDAIGMVDDRFLVTQKPSAAPVRRRLIVLIAAVLVLGLTVGSALAVSQELPQLTEMFIRILDIQTHEKPPEGSLPVMAPSAPEETNPTVPELQSINVVDIDGQVYAHYFRGEGSVQLFEGGFYTYTLLGEAFAPETFAFWEFQKNGVVQVESRRVDTILPYDGYEFRILFDYAVLQDQLCVMMWNELIIGDLSRNDWFVQAVEGRTDVVLLQLPVSIGTDYTNHYFLLDLETLEVTALFDPALARSIRIDWLTPTEDLRYALINGVEEQSVTADDWLVDLKRMTLTKVDDLLGFTAPSPYFMDDRTIITEQWLGDGFVNIVRYDIPTGGQTVLLERVTRANASGGYAKINKVFGLLYAEDDSAELIDLRTGERKPLTGLGLVGKTIKGSPNGKYILIAQPQWATDEVTSKCYPNLGLLDPVKGEMKLLTRDISGTAEYLRGWLDDETVVLTTRNANGSYYVLVYEFVQ